MARSKSSDRWLARHVSDPYVKRAQKDGYRSRAAYKLLEIDDRDRLLKPGLLVVDLGAAPGGWAQVAAARIAPGGRVIALDLLEMEEIPGVEFLRGDFTDDQVLSLLKERLAGRAADLVLSDMAPNMSGVDISDQARSMYLAELALAFVDEHLRKGGNFLVKTFQGAGFPEFFRAMRARFEQVLTRKPKASRAESRETYLLGKGFRGGG